MHYNFLCIGDIGNDSDSSEMKAFRENYAMLCNTMTDIDDLLKYFVSEEIITINEEERIKNCSTKSDKVRMLLLIISGPLQTGDKYGFYVMLKIMKKYGTKATQSLAELIKSSVSFNFSNTEGQRKDEQSKSMFHYYTVYYYA